MHDSKPVPSRPQQAKPSKSRAPRPGLSIYTEEIPPETIEKSNSTNNSNLSNKTPTPPTEPLKSKRPFQRKSETKINTTDKGSPTSVADLETDFLEKTISYEAQPFYDALLLAILKKFTRKYSEEHLTEQIIATINQTCLEITKAIESFKASLKNDPTSLCRSCEMSILWTDARYKQIKKLQNAIKPHIDIINNLLDVEASSPRARSLYSSPVGRKQAAQTGTFLEGTPFGKILESAQVSTALKQCFGPTAFSTKTEPLQYFQEVDGKVEELPHEPVKSEMVCFNTDVDTAVVLGVWEATSSAYAQDHAEMVNIYVPFGIATSSVVWNHELNEVRKKHSDDQIIIHTLRNPAEYQQLSEQYKACEATYLSLKSVENMPSEIVFNARNEMELAKQAMDDYLNQPPNWENAPINSSSIKIGSPKEKGVALKTIKRFVQKLRRTVEKSPQNAESPDATSGSDEDDDSSVSP